jgi:hypothetical protein
MLIKKVYKYIYQCVTYSDENMKSWFRSKISGVKSKIAKIAIATPIALLGETNSTVTFDVTPIINVVVAVIPLFVLLMVVKLLFQSFKSLD